MGQKINMGKSFITFSPNVKEAFHHIILSLLGIESAVPYDLYLGLPIVIGRNKRKVFASTKDRIWKLVQS